MSKKLISRRNFLKTTGFISAAGLLAACGGSSSSSTAVSSTAPASSAAAVAGTSVTKNNIKFGFLAPTLQTEFFIGIDDGLRAVAAEDGWTYTSVSF